MGEEWIGRKQYSGDTAALRQAYQAAYGRELPEWAAGMLCARGMDTWERLEAFLEPSLDRLAPPATLPGLNGAVDAFREMRESLGKDARLVVYGDYDVDGVVASVIMKEALEAFFGFDPKEKRVRVYIPDRHEEGYGLNLKAVEALCGEADAIVTVDCGVTSVNEAEAVRAWQEAHSERRYLVITDHHTPPDRLPEADALVNPQLAGAGESCDPLCGAGAALKIGWALCGDHFLDSHLDLCALATVADMVPLTGDNRIIVAEGLKKLRGMDFSAPARPGLAALCNISGVSGRMEGLSAGDIGFKLAPRLNAAGRLESAMNSVDLLTETDPDAAQRLCLKLEELNLERQEMVQSVRSGAEAQAGRMDLKKLCAIVAAGEGWESGVVGLAAGKIADASGYPTVCLSIQGDTCVGSARSASGIDLYRALKACADLFVRFGGHRQAAGLTMPLSNLEEFRTRLSDAVREQMDEMGKTELRREVFYDDELDLSDVTLDTVAIMEKMEPFGIGNPSPRFRISGCEAASLRAVGKDGAHLQGLFRQDAREVKGICFGKGDLATMAGRRADMIAVPYRNVYRGRESAEIRLEELRFEGENGRLRKEPAGKQEFLSPVSKSHQIPPDGVLSSYLALSEIGQVARAGTLLILCAGEAEADGLRAAMPGADVRTAAAVPLLTSEARVRYTFALVTCDLEGAVREAFDRWFGGRSIVRLGRA